MTFTPHLYLHVTMHRSEGWSSRPSTHSLHPHLQLTWRRFEGWSTQVHGHGNTQSSQAVHVCMPTASVAKDDPYMVRTVMCISFQLHKCLWALTPLPSMDEVER